MVETKLRFMRPAARSVDVNDVHVTSDEPSHIHIARPSRVLHRDNSGPSLEPTHEMRDRPAAPVMVKR